MHDKLLSIASGCSSWNTQKYAPAFQKLQKAMLTGAENMKRGQACSVTRPTIEGCQSEALDAAWGRSEMALVMAPGAGL